MKSFLEFEGIKFSFSYVWTLTNVCDVKCSQHVENAVSKYTSKVCLQKQIIFTLFTCPMEQKNVQTCHLMFSKIIVVIIVKRGKSSGRPVFTANRSNGARLVSWSHVRA